MSGDGGLNLLNTLLDAKWHLDVCDITDKEDALKAYHELLDQAREGREDISRTDIDRALREPWRDYCKKKRKSGS